MQPEPLVTTLGQAGYRLTRPRRQVAALIEAHRDHFTAAELIGDAQMRRVPVGRATIFRTLETFVELGLLERVALPTGGLGYVACSPPVTQHHHHVVCRVCGRTDEVAGCNVSSLALEVAERTGYQVDSHRIDLFGLCPSCRAAAAGRSGR